MWIKNGRRLINLNHVSSVAIYHLDETNHLPERWGIETKLVTDRLRGHTIFKSSSKEECEQMLEYIANKVVGAFYLEPYEPPPTVDEPIGHA